MKYCIVAEIRQFCKGIPQDAVVSIRWRGDTTSYMTNSNVTDLEKQLDGKHPHRIVSVFLDGKDYPVVHFSYLNRVLNLEICRLHHPILQLVL